MHLIDWKWAHITCEAGTVRGIPYDAALPEGFQEQSSISGEAPFDKAGATHSQRASHPGSLIYPGVRADFVKHQKHEKWGFRIHTYFHHMASSQAANANLFLPILGHPRCDDVLTRLVPGFARLAADRLDGGYCIEYWDRDTGSLHDHPGGIGTDVDLAIAYYDRQDEPCLWLIEHKLAEKEFTACGGYASQKNHARQNCSRSFADILADKDLCYYHSGCKFRYWQITEAHQAFFVNHAHFSRCPFRGGMNQLWRNQLLGLGIAQDADQDFRQVTFSVVRHPRNSSLDRTLEQYDDLIGHSPQFSVLTSADVVAAAAALHDPELDRWIAWYRELYDL